VAECQYAECCDDALPEMRFCRAHIEGLHFLFSQVGVRCPRCGASVPKGLLWHDCANPAQLPREEK